MNIEINSEEDLLELAEQLQSLNGKYFDRKGNLNKYQDILSEMFGFENGRQQLKKHLKEETHCIFEDLECADCISIEDDSFRCWDLNGDKDSDLDIIALELHGESGNSYCITVEQLLNAEKECKTWFIEDPDEPDNPFMLNCEEIVGF